MLPNYEKVKGFRGLQQKPESWNIILLMPLR